MKSCGKTVLLHANEEAFARAFVCAVTVLLLLPTVLMPVFSSDASFEKRKLADEPKLFKDGMPNSEILSDSGRYLEDHFAFRDALIEADSTVKQALFAESSVSEVIVGHDGWLFYEGELNDYWRNQTLSDAAIESAAINLSLVQENLYAKNKSFVLAIAPNKSSLYPERMPYYYVMGDGPSNYNRLLGRLRDLGVNVVDLQAVLQGQSGVYFHRDSHWNEEGALLAFESICQALHKTEYPLWGSATEMRGHLGDLDCMLHPLRAELEYQQHRPTLDAYAMANDAGSAEDAYIVTSSNAKEARGSLLVYRDSFGNNLMDPLACSYKTAVFTRLVPYNILEEQVGFADDVVIERAERHISSFATDPPYMEALERQIMPLGFEDGIQATVVISEEDGGMLVEGNLGRDLKVGERVYVQISETDGVTKAFEAFRMSRPLVNTQDFEGQHEKAHSIVEGDGGFRAYISRTGYKSPLAPKKVRLFVGSEESCAEIKIAGVEQ